MIQPSKGHVQEKTPDTFQDMIQPSEGHIQEIRQIHFKIRFSPQRVMSSKYARYISRHDSALKGPCTGKHARYISIYDSTLRVPYSGNTPDTFQDTFQPSKGHAQEIRQTHFTT